MAFVPGKITWLRNWWQDCSKAWDQALGLRVLLVRAAIARDVISDALREAGATVDVVEAYRNVVPDAAPEQLRAAVEKGIDAATFTSSSSVTRYLAGGGSCGWACVAVCGGSGGVDWTHYQRDFAGTWLGARDSRRILRIFQD